MRKFLLPVICILMLICTVNANAENVVNESGESRLEAESFTTWAHNVKKALEDASGGSYIYWDSGIGASKQKITVVANCPGLYDMDVIAGAKGANDMYSKITFDINGQTKTLQASDIDSSGESFAGYAGLGLKTFSVFEGIYLEEGENEILITIGERPNFPDRILAQLDAFMFSPSNTLPKIEGGEVIVEVESFDAENNRNIEAASGGVTVGFYDNAEDAYSITTYVNVINEGEYDINVWAAADDGTSSVLSYLDIKINGGKNIRMDSSSCKITDLGFDAGRADLSDHPASSFMYNDKIYFEEGINSIEVILTENAKRGHIFGAVDCIRIGKQVDISGLSVENLILGIDDTEELVLTNADGEAVTLYDVDSLDVVIANESVAVYEDLKITGINMGKTSVSVIATAGDSTVTANGVIDVVGESSLYIVNASKNENDVSVTLSASQDFSADGSRLLLLVYGNNNGMTTSLKQVITADIEDIKEGETKELDMGMDSLDKNDAVAVFIADATLTKTLYGKTIVE